MYNRKFNFQKDFRELIKLENEIIPAIEGIKNEDEKEKVKNYVRKVFDNQWK